MMVAATMTALAVAGLVWASRERAPHETGSASEPSYHGELAGVELRSGRYVPLPGVALGTLPGRGLVTAESQLALLRGDAFPVPRAGAWAPLRAVYYRRQRPGYRGKLWRHELAHTGYRQSANGPVFKSLGKSPARVCPIAGEFICDG